MDKLLDPKNKPKEELLSFIEIQDGRRGSKIQFFTNLWLKNDILALQMEPVHPIWTKFGMDILFHHSNKPVNKFHILIEIQDGRQGVKC